MTEPVIKLLNLRDAYHMTGPVIKFPNLRDVNHMTRPSDKIPFSKGCKSHDEAK